MKKARNDTYLLLHPPENEDHKGLPDLLTFKSCTAYIGNLKNNVHGQFPRKGTTNCLSQGQLE